MFYCSLSCITTTVTDYEMSQNCRATVNVLNTIVKSILLRCRASATLVYCYSLGICLDTLIFSHKCFFNTTIWFFMPHAHRRLTLK